MKRLLACFLLLFAIGCITPTFTPVCRHYAVFHAITIPNHYPVRIAVGPSTRANSDGIYHAQAQYLGEDGEWHWLTSAYVIVEEVPQDPFTPIAYYTVKDFLRFIHED